MSSFLQKVPTEHTFWKLMPKLLMGKVFIKSVRGKAWWFLLTSLQQLPILKIVSASTLLISVEEVDAKQFPKARVKLGFKCGLIETAIFKLFKASIWSEKFSREHFSRAFSHCLVSLVDLESRCLKSCLKLMSWKENQFDLKTHCFYLSDFLN